MINVEKGALFIVSVEDMVMRRMVDNIMASRQNRDMRRCLSWIDREIIRNINMRGVIINKDWVIELGIILFMIYKIIAAYCISF